MKGTGTILFISFVLMANLQNAENKRMSLEEMKNNLLPLKKHCIAKVGTDPKMIDDANNGNFVSDWRLKCYYKCMLLNTKMMKNDKIDEKFLINVVQVMVLEESVPLVMKAIEYCLPVVKELKGCELAYALTKCYYDYDPLVKFFA